jgi:hypothetical protein
MVQNFPAYERIETAIRLGKPDRVPVAPIIDSFASLYGGITHHDMFFDVRKYDQALAKTMNDLGQLDAQSLSYAGMGSLLMFIFPTPPRLPGTQGLDVDAQWQFVERSIMDADDYRRMNEEGFLRWSFKKLLINHPQLRSPAGFAKTLAEIGRDQMRIAKSYRAWRKKGLETMTGNNIAFTSMEWVSIALRSYTDFVLDLYRHTEDLKLVRRPIMNFFKRFTLATSTANGVRRVFMGGARTSASSLGPKQFEELALPEWLELSEYFIGKNITPLLHMDSDWTPFFPYFKDFPRGKCIMNLDGSSDIFKAKEILDGHMCIMGDVPATLLKLGEPDEVSAYCERLIKELGKDGGFILSSGCTVPIDAKPENVKAMIESVHHYKA